jgi:hypothetical protein
MITITTSTGKVFQLQLATDCTPTEGFLDVGSTSGGRGKPMFVVSHTGASSRSVIKSEFDTPMQSLLDGSEFMEEFWSQFKGPSEGNTEDMMGSSCDAVKLAPQVKSQTPAGASSSVEAPSKNTSNRKNRLTPIMSQKAYSSSDNIMKKTRRTKVVPKQSYSAADVMQEIRNVPPRLPSRLREAKMEVAILSAVIWEGAQAVLQFMVPINPTIQLMSSEEVKKHQGRSIDLSVVIACLHERLSVQ